MSSTSADKSLQFGIAEMSRVRSVLGPKCLDTSSDGWPEPLTD